MIGPFKLVSALCKIIYVIGHRLKQQHHDLLVQNQFDNYYSFMSYSPICYL